MVSRPRRVACHCPNSPKVRYCILPVILLVGQEPKMFLQKTDFYSPLPKSFHQKIRKKLHGMSPRANYTDQVTAACRQSQRQLLRMQGVSHGQHNRYSRQYSWLSRPEPLLLRKSGSAGNRTWDLWICSKEL
jgi:hypothetical protein